MNEERDEIGEAIRELEKRSREIARLGIASPTQVARMLDQFNVTMAELATREGAANASLR